MLFLVFGYSYNTTTPEKQRIVNLLLIAGSEGAVEVEDVDAALGVSTAFGMEAATGVEGTIWSKKERRHKCQREQCMIV